MDNTFYKLSKKELDKSLEYNGVNLKDALNSVENYAQQINEGKVEALFYSLALRAHLLVERHGE